MWPWLAAALATAAITVVAVIAATTSGTTINGQMTVFDSTSAVFTSDGTCVTYGGFAEIGNGTTVTVRDASDAIVATGSLGPGRASGTSCVFAYSIPGVPTSDYYTVEVAKRGPLTYSAAELEAGSVRQELRSMY